MMTVTVDAGTCHPFPDDMHHAFMRANKRWEDFIQIKDTGVIQLPGYIL